jgi:hypothetical protein
MSLPPVMTVPIVYPVGDLFDAAAMYDEDYLYFFAAPGDLRKLAEHGLAVLGAGVPDEAAAELA